VTAVSSQDSQDAGFETVKTRLEMMVPFLEMGSLLLDSCVVIT